jgi:hypothetical protein
MKIKTMVQPDKHSFTKWTASALKYKFVCCDCGLTHDIEFMVRLKGGRILDRRKGQIKFRVRRNARSTAAVRRCPQRCR